MKEIKINDTLLKKLKNDYENAEFQIKFMYGLDYLEAMVKFFAALNISVVQKINPKIYEKIFYANFKISPSFGDYKSLATKPFCYSDDNIDKKLKIYDSLQGKDPLYDMLYQLFTEKLELELDNISKMMEEGKASKLKKGEGKSNNLQELFDNYVVGFRNKLKGHGASFDREDIDQANIILRNLDNVIEAIETQIKKLLKNKKLSFHVVDSGTKINKHTPLEVIAQYANKKYRLSPLIIYLECDKFSCKDKHLVKLFFYNDGKASKSYYIDYSFNHYYYFSSNNKVDNTLKELVHQQKEINAHATSDNQRRSSLISVFVGRDEELKKSKEHILKNIASDNPSAITIKGKPGIGKSAFISKLQEELREKIPDIQTYIFYVRKGEMDEYESKYFYNNLNAFVDAIGIGMLKVDNTDELTAKEKLEELFKILDGKLKEPLLLVVDGLDEFKSPVSFVESFPMQNIPNKLHLVFSTREYSNILDTLQFKLFSDSCNIDLLNKESYKIESASITLGKLSQYEVGSLLSEVLPKEKEIQRDTQIYKDIQEKIYVKSEGLPLYIHYITNKLIELDPKSSDIASFIFQYAKELPSNLEDFYFNSFKKLKTESRQIIYSLYFAHKHIGFDSFYHLIRGLNKSTIDEIEFQNDYFNEVEIFLSQDTEDKYGFYHLSVKEAIKSYFMQEKKLQHIVEIDYEIFAKNNFISPYQVEQYKETFDTHYYLKENSSLFILLKGICRYLSDNQNNEDLKELYEDNYLTYFYKYINFRNYHEVVIYKDMKNKDYSKFENVKLSENIIQLIEKFFEDYDISKKQDFSQIKYAHMLALLVKDYDKVLRYTKEYKDAFFTLFVDIIWHLEDPANQKLFKELKPIWTNVYSDMFKFILLHNKKLLANVEYMLEIVNTLQESSYKAKALAFIGGMTNNSDLLVEALDHTNQIEAIYMKEDALSFIIVQIDKLYSSEKALDLVRLLEKSYDKAKVLASIGEMINDTQLIEQALEIANSIEDTFDKDKVLAFIGKKINNIEQALKIINPIENTFDKAKVLSFIGVKFDDPKLIEQALEIANSIENSFDKANALVSIGEMIHDTQLIDQALEIANSIEDTFDKARVLLFIGRSTDILEKALDNVKLFGSIYFDIDQIIAIMAKINDKDLGKKALEITNSLESSFDKDKVLALICKKIDNIEKALEIVNLMENDLFKLRSLIVIVRKTDNQKQIDKVLQITKSLKFTHFKDEVLLSIVKKTYDIEKALKIVNSIEYYKDEALAFIELKRDNVEKALEITNSIESSFGKAKVLASIGVEFDDPKLIEKALEITKILKPSQHKVDVLEIIIEKTNDQRLLDEVITFANLIENTYEKNKVLVSIASKVDNIEKILEIISLIKDDIEREKVFINMKNRHITFTGVSSYLYTLNYVLNFNITKSFEYVAHYNEDAILKYFNILNT